MSMVRNIWEAYDLLDDSMYLTPERTNQEVAFIREQFPQKLYQHVVDLGCGEGRIALPLLSNGYHVTGIDIREHLIEDLTTQNNYS